MKTSVLILLILFLLFPTTLHAAKAPAVGVAPFQVNGPASAQYLAGAVQDAIVGALLQKGVQAKSISKKLDPAKLNSVRQGGKDLSMVVTGRINVVGSQYRVFLKWVREDGVVGQKYLQVKNLDDLLPQMETFAGNTLAQPVWVLTSPKKEAIEKLTAPKPVVEKPKPPEVAPPPPQPYEEPVKVSKKKKKKKKEEPVVPLRDYDFVSQRLPFEVRSISYGDINGDGQKEVLMTSQRKLYLYSFSQGQMELLAEYAGNKLDYFVKVDLWKKPGQKPWVVLTNLREDQSSGKILRFEGGQFIPVVENIPYQMRVVQRNGEEQLIGSTYTAQSTRAAQNIFRLAVEGSKIKSVEKLNLPWGTHLYNYDWVTNEGSKDVVRLTPEGKLQVYTLKDEKKFKKAYTSRGKYGGTANWVPVEVTNFFNEVVSDFYPIPPGVRTLKQGGKPDIFVVKNDSLLKNVVGRIPVIKDGQIFRLSIDPLGLVEAWASKKIDGSIQDYLVTNPNGNPQLMVAVRLRDPGLLGDVGRKDSVLLLYNLN